MGLRQKIAKRIYREETASFIIDSVTNKNSPPSFIPALIRMNYTNVENLEHLEKVARNDPVATYITYKLSENTLDDGFIFQDDDGNEIMQPVQKELKLLNAKKALIQALIAERTYGYAYQYTGKNRYIPTAREGGRIASLHAFSPRKCVVFEYNEDGTPKTMEITIQVGTGQLTVLEKKLRLPADDFIFWNTRPIGRGYKGRSALEPVWDMLAYRRYLEHSMTFFGIKMGSGLFTITTKEGIGDEIKGKMNTAYADVSNRRAIINDGSIIEKMEFIGPQGATTDFGEHLNWVLSMIAAGTGIPLESLIGATGGTNESASTNEKSLFATLNQIQTSIEPYIRELVKRMGFADENYNIAWNTRYAHDEEEESKIAYNNAGTLQIRSAWLTINEIREIEGLPPKEGGDKLKSDFQIDVSGMQTPDEKEQDRNDMEENT